MDETAADGADAEADCYRGEEPPWAHPFAHDIAWELEEGIGDVKGREDGVVVVSGEV